MILIYIRAQKDVKIKIVIKRVSFTKKVPNALCSRAPNPCYFRGRELAPKGLQLSRQVSKCQLQHSMQPKESTCS